jgi:hypothetical protein
LKSVNNLILLIESEFKRLERATQQSTIAIASEGKLVSAKQGTTLGKDILKGGYAWNSDFNEKAVSTNHRIEVELTPSVKITLLSPNDDKLSNLLEFWKRKLYKSGLPTTITEEGILLFTNSLSY